MPRTRAAWAGVLAPAGALWALAAVWWWALRGMSEDVGAAHGLTAGVVLLISFIMAMP